MVATAYLQVFDDIAATSGSKRFNGVQFALFHACGFAALDDGNALATVNLIGRNAVAVEVVAASNLVRFALELDFSGLFFALIHV